MSKIKYYTDEHIPKAVVLGLRHRGVDVISCQEANMLGCSDLEHLKWANQNGRILITQDNDFLVLHHKGIPHSGIAFAPQPLSVGDYIRVLLLIYEVLTPDEMVNHVEFL